MNGDVSLGLAHEAEVMLRKVGATRENFWIPISKDKELARRVVELVNARPSYNVVVDYGRSLAQMIDVGGYDWINSDITEEHFLVEGEGKQERKVTLFHFGHYIESEEVIIAEIDSQGYRPAVIEELLALGETEPELQREFLIVALGSAWRDPHGDRRMPFLCRLGSRRLLSLSWFGLEWFPNYRFAALRK